MYNLSLSYKLINGIEGANTSSRWPRQGAYPTRASLEEPSRRSFSWSTLERMMDW